MSHAKANRQADTAGIGDFSVLCPARVHPNLRRDMYDDRPFYRARQRPGRLQLFLPGWVLTLSRTKSLAGGLRGEVRGARKAEQLDFWKGLPAPVLPLGGRGILRRRHQPAELSDFEFISQLLSERLLASLDEPTVGALSQMRGMRSFRALSTARQKATERTLVDLRLPWTGMHGDLHLFNFLQRQDVDGYWIIDWEYFDPRGSFAYDFIDFFVAGVMIQRGGQWEGVLAERKEWLPAARHVSNLFGVDLQALLVYYLCLKTDIIIRHLGMSLQDPDGAGPRLIALLSREIDRLAAQRQT